MYRGLGLAPGDTGDDYDPWDDFWDWWGSWNPWDPGGGSIGPGGKDYATFTRRIRSKLLEKARATGIPVFCLWFGELVGVDENNTLIVINPNGNVQYPPKDEAIDVVKGWLIATAKLYAWCYLDGVFWLVHVTEDPVPADQVPPPGTGTSFFEKYWQVLALGGLTLFVFLGDKKKGN